MSEKQTILTPVGRLVQGDCFEGSKTDAEGRPLVIKNGPNAGQPRVDYFMAIAIPKTDATYMAEVHNKVHQTAALAFPTLFDASGKCINPAFAFKITDGDSQIPNTKGISPCTREGFPGHWILNFSGGFAPKVYTKGGGEAIVDKTAIKRGDYIRIYGSVAGNGSMQQPGVYLNHSMVEFIGHGVEIITGPDATAVFGGAPAATPAAASATPVAPVTPIAAPVAVVQTPAAVTPANDFLNPPGAPAAPAAPVEKSYNIGGTVYTETALRAAGWTDVQLAQQTPVA